MTVRVAVVRDAGPQRRGLAYRFALAGHSVVLGSWSLERAISGAAEINARIGSPTVSGTTNADAAREADMALLAVPWTEHLAHLRRWPTYWPTRASSRA